MIVTIQINELELNLPEAMRIFPSFPWNLTLRAGELNPERSP